MEKQKILDRASANEDHAQLKLVPSGPHVTSHTSAKQNKPGKMNCLATK